jgi:hypothetical protein
MTPRPLHRWKSLWFGLPVLAFLGWGWLVSTEAIRGASWFPSERGAILWNHGGEVSMFLGECPPDMGTGFEAWTLLENGPWFAPAVGALDSQSGILFSIAHWLLILLFLLIWAGFLAWRVRRMKRLAAAPETDRYG